jgi:hypothetical protein
MRELRTVAAIEEIFGHLPPKLSDVYSELLEKIEALPSAADRACARECPIFVHKSAHWK